VHQPGPTASTNEPVGKSSYSNHGRRTNLFLRARELSLCHSEPSVLCHLLP
jgi:hypothetical protein